MIPRRTIGVLFCSRECKSHDRIKSGLGKVVGLSPIAAMVAEQVNEAYFMNENGT